jgi:hypothetical protein
MALTASKLPASPRAALQKRAAGTSTQTGSRAYPSVRKGGKERIASPLIPTYHITQPAEYARRENTERNDTRKCLESTITRRLAKNAPSF